MFTYSTRPQAIRHEIIEPLEEFAKDFDVEGIADKVIGFDPIKQRYFCSVDPNRFWEIVEEHNEEAG